MDIFKRIADYFSNKTKNKFFSSAHADLFKALSDFFQNNGWALQNEDKLTLTKLGKEYIAQHLGETFFNNSPEADPESLLKLAANLCLFTPTLDAPTFEKKPYRIRSAELTDIDDLEKIEKECWPKELQIKAKDIEKRLTAYPQGHFVLELNGQVVGVIYSQRITSVDQIKTMTSKSASGFHNKTGTVVQLLAVNISPQVQSLHLGDDLLEFMLQRCSLMPEVEQVVAVTLCKNYDKQTTLSLADYIHARNPEGHVKDPILRFHELHGAHIQELIPGYRPKDKKNEETGVLVTYDIHRRARKEVPLAETPIKVKDSFLDADVFLATEIKAILGEEKGLSYTSKSPLMEMGLDSSDLLILGEKIRLHYHVVLDPAFFFSYNTVEKIHLFLSTHLDALPESDFAPPTEAPIIEEPAPSLGSNGISPAHDMAIIGMACRLPGGVNSPEELWNFLKEGKSAIREMPSDRWIWPQEVDVKACPGMDRGGFLDDIAAFDAPFFRISRKDAEMTDPQQRIALELAWEALESAGYSQQALAGSNTGVFIGASGSDYHQLVTEEHIPITGHSGLTNALAILANRISYFYDFHGPSLQIDTACSSSLVALYEAIKSLREGECTQALVGGISIMCHPENSIAYYKAGMLSPEGECRPFDHRANGYVRSEGCVMFLIKPLQLALYDKDSVIAVIKGAACNHGGLASGLTVPNPDQQAELILAAWADAVISPYHLSYIEAHGTGTSLGDPVEIRGLKEAFGVYPNFKPYTCGFGSIKSNLGHLEAASGLAGLLKVVLGLEHKQIPRSINFEQLNPYINLENTPLYIVDQLTAWNAPEGALRRAGVSSFGSGGTNAHVIIEEHVTPAPVPIKTTAPLIFVLSAKSRERLQAYVQKLLHFLLPRKDMAFSLESLLYTLQCREQMEHRLAFLVNSFDDLTNKLQNIQSIELQPQNPIMERWLNGAAVNWDSFYDPVPPVLNNLPHYPFAKEHYWIRKTEPKQHFAAQFHPLLQENISDFPQEKYKSHFTGDEFFLKDHVINGLKILPAVAYLEMAYKAICAAAKKPQASMQIKDIVWSKPIIVDTSQEVYTMLMLDKQGDILCQVTSSLGEEKACFQGKASIISTTPPTAPKLVDLQILPAEQEFTAQECYERLATMGFQYGPGHRAVESLRVTQKGMLAKISLPSFLMSISQTYTLHPSLCDGALQAAILFLNKGESKLLLPFSLDSIEIFSPSPNHLWAWVHQSEKSTPNFQKVDIDLYDNKGNMVIRMQGFAARSPDEEKAPKSKAISKKVTTTGVENEKIVKMLQELASELLKMPIEALDANSELSEFGFDSIDFTEFADDLNQRYALGVNPTIFFEYPTLASLAKFLSEQYSSQLAAYFPSKAEEAPVKPVSAPLSAQQPFKETIAPKEQQHAEPIAIIGMSGAFPMAHNVEEFWQNLVEGKDCISEIPADRWDWKAYWGDPTKEANKTNVKWGGFLDSIAEFDPLFFGISPREALLMDPQQRLLMKHVWLAIEDAGYSAESLSGSKTGMFIGTVNSGYHTLFEGAHIPIESYTATGTFPSVGPNRMSYFLNLHGSSEPVETACSTSLVTIHRALLAIQNGECDQAIVGGVNTIVTPEMHISFNKAGMLSEDGRCKTFSKYANGYGRGEGVGMLILKKLSAAEADGDHIYGLIRSSAENHGGRANSLTAPNPKAQADLLIDAYTKAGIDPRTVSYIEAHGTGTPLGDPIEINGLKSAFAALYQKTSDSTINNPHCGLGTVKSNIGHLELAAGVAGVIKVLLQMKHQMLVKNLHSEEQNPYIDLNNTPFYIVRENKPWDALKDQDGRVLPRVAGVSSFGFGGVNAHVVLEEYIPKPQLEEKNSQSYLILLSAKKPERLLECAQNLFFFLEQNQVRLSDLAYTLQVGRTAMEERLALHINTLEDLKDKLTKIIAGETPKDTYRSKKRDQFSTVAQEGLQEAVEKWLQQKNLVKLAEAWTQGTSIDWSQLYEGKEPRRIALPTYPFARDVYWPTITPSEEMEHIEEVVAQAEEVEQTEETVEFGLGLEPILSEIAAKIVDLPIKEIETGRSLSDYGFDSFAMTEFALELSDKLKLTIEPSLFFEHPTIASLASYLGKKYEKDLAALFPSYAPKVTKTAVVKKKPVPQAPSVEKKSLPPVPSDAIAVIGMSGAFPMAHDLDEFWQNLLEGKDCISEIPPDRWDWKAYWGDPEKEENKTNVKWGGFLDSVADFDPLFFGISPREAFLMDPQHRLLMEYVWKAIEEAGYSAESLSGSKTGIFVGTIDSGYAGRLQHSGVAIEGYTSTGEVPSVGPNRMSYFLNLHGPSEPIETACSSSLVAIHRAISAIQRGDCDQAIVGGVNTIVTPEFQISFSKAGMLSKDGRCKTFSKDANGYVRGEGVGMIFLKRLKAAEADGDHIYAVIRNSAENHGGKSSSLTAPNTSAQTDLLIEAYKKVGIDPHQVSYIEVHGTGTPLGDPVEVNGLKAAFSSLLGEEAISTPYCGLGTVKSNIGHLEVAAGIAGVIKVLLQMHHKTLVKTLHSENQNPYINLGESPFYIIRENREWDSPRIAGVSSFGFGGVNAHIVLEEYVPQPKPQFSLPAVIIPLSARSQGRLLEQIKQLLAYLEIHSEVDLVDLAYTLQVGREAMEERLAFIVPSVDVLKKTLQRYLSNDENIIGLYRGNIKSNREQSALFEHSSIFREALDKSASDYQLEDLASLWVRGVKVPWQKLYGDHQPSRLSLPTYPFVREKYWVKAVGLTPSLAPASTYLHPLLQENCSTLSEMEFRSQFSGEEFFLSDHVVKGFKVLPGVAYLEMAFAAIKHAVKEPLEQIELRNIIWSSPLIVQAPLTAKIVLASEEDVIDYEIYTQNGEETIIHSSGQALFPLSNTHEPLDLAVLKVARPIRELNSQECYERFEKMGLHYGAGFQSIELLRILENGVLAKLKLPYHLDSTLNSYTLHPSILDGALQASIGLFLQETGEAPLLPFALDSITIYDPCVTSMWAWVRRRETIGTSQKLDIDLCNDEGVVSASLIGLSLRPMEANLAMSTLALHPVWKEKLIELHTDVNIDFRVMEIDAMASFEEQAVRLFAQVHDIIQGKPENNLLLQVIIHDPLQFGLSGLLKTAHLENPKIYGQVILIEEGQDKEAVLKDNRQSIEDVEVKYVQGRRYNRSWEEFESAPSMNSPWKDEGVYLITGGAGGLGLIFANEIASKVSGAKIILTGRSAINNDIQKRLTELHAGSCTIDYRQINVSQKEAVKELIDGIVQQYGTLNGVLHAAGVVHDNYLLHKTEEEFRQVLLTKVWGTIYLDEATKDLPLDFFIFFSSIAGVFGNAGQADYATANSFMDSYAQWRQEKVTEQKRHGRSLTLNWPLWKEGGMHVDAAAEALMKRTLGIIPLDTQAGLNAFSEAWATNYDEVMILQGNSTQIRSMLKPKPPQIDVVLAGKTEGYLDAPAVTDYIRKLIASFLKVDAYTIQVDEPLDKYGIDSLLSMQITQLFEEKFGALSKTLLFEYQTIKALSQYFAKHHADKINALVRGEGPKAAPQVAATPQAQKHLSRMSRGPVFNQRPLSQDIAIIGISGRYPQSPDLETLWQNLSQGVDCVTEVPPSRWDWRQYYDENKTPGKHFSKWGGFIEGVEEFDPLFFNISPREALSLDPQERLFLEEVWKALEDSGTCLEDLKRDPAVGVYVGVMWSEYQLYSHDEIVLGNSDASIANRISYFLDLHGPSIALDTMCSSSLTAIHLACEDLKLGHTALAIAGGVNISIHPNKYLQLSASHFISSDGHCQSFGIGGDGYIPAEGVGAVILKRLEDALRDGDRIHALIKGTALNHGGKTRGFTVPNPTAQKMVIEEALKSARINPKAISYIEAHGTGTKLGDPIEIAGLNNAFEELGGVPDSTIWVGSVKSNMGHCESAAGVAGLTKVILQMQHKQITPSLHSDILNPFIDFEKTPFKINQTLREWIRPVIDGKEYPRIAGLSSFGAGGSNAHMIIQEYSPSAQASQAIAFPPPFIIPLSARNKDRLVDYAKLMATHLEKHADVNIADLAFTLQIGREAMDERLMIFANSTADLVQKLSKFLEGAENIEGLLRGNAKQHKEQIEKFENNSELQEAVEKWIENRKLTDLADLWVKGLRVDWKKLYVDQMPRRISLPTYPFARDKYWVSPPKKQDVVLSQTELRSAPEISSHVEEIAHERVERPTAKVTQENLIKELRESLAATLYLSSEDIDIDASFTDMGVDSIIGVGWIAIISKKYAIDISQGKIYDFPSIRRFAEFLQNELQANKAGLALETPTSLKIGAEGFVDRPKAQLISLEHPAPSSMPSKVEKETLIKELSESLAATLYLPSEAIDVDASFSEMGVDSIIGVGWIATVSKQYDISISQGKIYDFPSIRKFAAFLQNELQSNQAGLALETPASLKTGVEGSLDRPKAQLISLGQPVPSSIPSKAEKETLIKELSESLATTLYLPSEAIDVDASFSEMGVDSIIGVGWIATVSKQYAISISQGKIYDFPSIRKFAAFLQSELQSNQAGLALDVSTTIKEIPQDYSDRPKAKLISLDQPTPSSTPLTIAPQSPVTNEEISDNPCDYDLHLISVPGRINRTMICVHGFGGDYQLAQKIHSWQVVPVTLVGFNFPHLDINQDPPSKIPNDFEGVLPLLYVLHKYVVGKGLTVIDLYGFSGGAGAIIKTIALLNSKEYDAQLANIGIGIQEKELILSAIQNGFTILDAPFRSLTEVIEMTGLYKKWEKTAKNLSKKKWFPIDQVVGLKDLSLNLIVFFQRPDEVLSNRDDSLLAQRLFQANNNGVTEVIVGSDGGHETIHWTLWKFLKERNLWKAMR